MSPRRIISLSLFSIITLLALSACGRFGTGSEDLSTPTEAMDANVGGGVDGGTASQPEAEAYPPPASEGGDVVAETPVQPTAEVSVQATPAASESDESSAEVAAPTDPEEEEQATPEVDEAESTAVTETETQPADGTLGTPPSEEIIHYAQAGENLFRIGLQYGYSWTVLAQYNGIANPNHLMVGQPIRIPPAAGSEPPPADGNYTDYVVQPGDNLFQIGLKFGMSWVLIAEANGIVNPHHLVPGQILKIPILPGAQQL